MSSSPVLSWQPKDIAGVPNGLILFDGVCVLCSGWVRFVLERDRDGWFCFTPIQSPYGRALAERLGIDADNPQTNAVVVRGRAHFKFDTVIAILERLPRWHWARALALMPRPLRNFIYDRVAQNRYRWFGRTESCMVPTPEIAQRFLHDDPPAALPRPAVAVPGSARRGFRSLARRHPSRARAVAFVAHRGPRRSLHRTGPACALAMLVRRIAAIGPRYPRGGSLPPGRSAARILAAPIRRPPLCQHDARRGPARARACWSSISACFISNSA